MTKSMFSKAFTFGHGPGKVYSAPTALAIILDSVTKIIVANVLIYLLQVSSEKTHVTFVLSYDLIPFGELSPTVIIEL